jgi:hypothetical protein
MNKKPSLVVAVLAVLVSLCVGNANAQTATDKKALVNRTRDLMSRLPAQHQKLLSSGMQRILQVAQALNDDHSKMGDAGTTTIAPKVRTAANGPIAAFVPLGPIPGPGPGGTIAVSDPRLDFVNSTMSSFTQSETSAAWCGNTVVAGYNDSGAFARTAGVDFLGPWSFSSASYSNDGGRTFVDIGFMNPGTNPINFIAGDPVVVCTSPTQFYYASIFASGQDSSGAFFNGVAVNASSNGGQTWGNPVAAVAKDFSHGIDKPWLAADPTNANRLYVTYTDFDFSGLFGSPGARCPNDIRYAIELVASADGGSSWGAPVIVHEECFFAGGFNGVQGSNPVVAQDGTVYVGYEFYPGSVPNNEIRLAKSSDHGQTFGAPVKVSNVWPNGNFGVLQGGFRNNEFPQVAVDRSGGSSRGTIYVAWSDGINHIVPDLPVFFGTYAYPDVMVAKSIDGGQTFTARAAVSPVSPNFRGRGRDQFFPGLAVDRRGTVGVCYYDRREDPANTVIDRYCSVSENHGASWQEERVSEASWVPAHAADGVINLFYIGDYDALTSDFLLQHGGFFGTFEVQTNGNPDVVAARLSAE